MSAAPDSPAVELAASLGFESFPVSPDPIRIYVACLAAYNNGHLHGVWIDAGRGDSHIWEQTRAMLKSSPIPNAEEWAIHDYEGFQGAALGEYTSFETVDQYAQFIETHGELGGKILTDCAGHMADAQAKLDSYIGQYDSLEDYAREYIEQTLTEIPPSLEHYIDYESMGRDMEINGLITTIETDAFCVHVFAGG